MSQLAPARPVQMVYVHSCARCGCPYLLDSVGSVRPAPMLPFRCVDRSCDCHVAG